MRESTSSPAPALLTLPEAHRRYGIGLTNLRAAARRGEFPLYAAGTNWPRVRLDEFEAWLRSTRIPVQGASSA